MITKNQKKYYRDAKGRFARKPLFYNFLDWLIYATIQNMKNKNKIDYTDPNNNEMNY